MAFKWLMVGVCVHPGRATYFGDGDPGCNAGNWDQSSKPSSFAPVELDTDNWVESYLALGERWVGDHRDRSWVKTLVERRVVAVNVCVCRRRLCAADCKAWLWLCVVAVQGAAAKRVRCVHTRTLLT